MPCMLTPDVYCATITHLATWLQAFTQQSSYNASSNQPSYGRPDAGPGIDSSLAAHIPGGQGVGIASEQVRAKHTRSPLDSVVGASLNAYKLSAGFWTCGRLWHWH